MDLRIAINGAGIAGTALAFWLRRAGHEVLLVEQAPRPRTGGYIIDFWGIGYDIADRMGLIPAIRARGYRVQEVRLVDRAGRACGGFPVDAFVRVTHGRFTSVRRSDVAGVLFEALDPGVEKIFGDSIAAIEPAGERVRIAFDHAPPREVDLVVGADGLHSRVRTLAFDAEARFEVPLGYHVAAFEAEGYRPRDELVYVSHGIPGRQVSRFSMRGDRTLFLFVLRDEYLPATPLASDAERKAALAHAFQGAGWECPRILDEMRRADDLYFDRVSQIRMPRWSAGRVALAGDAAACVSFLAGEGTGLAIAEAYVLAGELLEGAHDVPGALARYEERLMPFLRRKQAGAAKLASSFAPATAAGLAFRNLASRLMRIPSVAEWLLGRDLRDEVDLPGYSFP
jgi:2-polyprenyl-6-methoxyphenol hydroxylase-like FAD-dependent oxidoreductase